MDTEIRLISALLSANKAEQQEFWDKQLPLTLFALREQEMHWINRFREQHGRYPTPQAFQLKFREELEQVTDPLKAAVDPVLAQAAFAQIKTVIDKVGEMFDENKDPAEIIGFFRNAADRVQSFDVEYVDESLKDSNIALRRYREQVKKLSVKGSFLDSPWPRMNKIINFCRPGELIVCAARLGLGKTWVISRWAEHLAGQGIETFFMSKEMPTQQISDRMTALRYRLDWPRFRSLQLDVFDQIRWKIKRYKTRNQPYPLLVSGEETFEGTGLQQLYSKILRVKPRAVFVDGAYLFNVPGLSKNANEVEKLTAISRGLKRIAKVTQTTVFAVIQMNRNAENKKGVALGGVTTAYGSDSWAQDADTFFEIAGERGADERVVKVHKSRETNIGDYFINFKLSPHPDFSEKSRLSSGSALGQVPFKTIV